MPVLLAHAIEDSTDIFGISGGGGFEPPQPRPGTPLGKNTNLKDETQNTKYFAVFETCTPGTPLRTFTQTSHRTTLTVL